MYSFLSLFSTHHNNNNTGGLVLMSVRFTFSSFISNVNFYSFSFFSFSLLHSHRVLSEKGSHWALSAYELLHCCKNSFVDILLQRIWLEYMYKKKKEKRDKIFILNDDCCVFQNTLECNKYRVGISEIVFDDFYFY